MESTYTSLPWGDDLSPSGDNGDQYDFASLDRDLEDNTEHAQFRNYSVNQGRWLSPDPYYGSYDATNPQSFNRFSYALNNPVSFIDPSGQDCVFFDGDGRPQSADDAGFDETTDINPQQCGSDGGSWVDGSIDWDSVGYNQGIWSFSSTDASGNPVSTTIDTSYQTAVDVSVNAGPGTPADLPLDSDSGLYTIVLTYAPSNGTPKPAPSPTPQQPPKQPWYCGTGNSWSNPFTAPTSRQYGLWSVSDAAIATYSTKLTGGKPNPVSEVFTAASLIEGWGWAACN